MKIVICKKKIDINCNKIFDIEMSLSIRENIIRCFLWNILRYRTQWSYFTMLYKIFKKSYAYLSFDLKIHRRFFRSIDLFTRESLADNLAFDCIYLLVNFRTWADAKVGTVSQRRWLLFWLQFFDGAEHREQLRFFSIPIRAHPLTCNTIFFNIFSHSNIF